MKSMTEDLTLNLTTIQPGTGAPEVFGWERVLEICGSWDTQALVVAWLGLFLTGVYMFYWLRWRERVGEDNVRYFLDKFGFTLLMLCWVIVIVRMLRAA